MVRSMNVAWWVCRWSELTPDKPAVVLESESVNFADLYRRVVRCGRWLEAVGLRRGNRLAIMLPNGVEFLELYLAAAALGVVFVPLNFRCAPEEIEYFLDNCDADLFVVDEGLLAPLAEAGVTGRCARKGTAVVSDGDASSRPSGGATATLHDYREEVADVEGGGVAPAGWFEEGDVGAPQIIMYTSGTTGRPKGALLSYRKTFFNCLNAEHFLKLGHDDVMLVMLPMFHSGGLLIQTSPSLYKGMTIVLHRRFSARNFYEAVRVKGVTRFVGVPTIYRLLLKEEAWRGTDLSVLGVCGIGGEKSDPLLAQRCAEAGFSLCELMGQTEASIFLSASAQDLLRKPGTVGRPVFHVEVRVVNGAGAAIPAGEVGEIEVRGPIVMNGYWRDEVKTAEALRDGWLRTGDLAWRDSEGFYFLVGREKDMYISGGENVYPAEIERVLRQHPAVGEAAVVGVEDPLWGQVGHAFVVAAEGSALRAEDLAGFCAQHLAAYKVPCHFSVCAALPRTAIGKVRKADLKLGR